MDNSVQKNMLSGLLLPIAILILILGIATVVTNRLIKRGNLLIGLFPLLFWVVLALYGLVVYGKGFIYPIEYFVNGKQGQGMSIGQIEAVQPGPKYPIYYDPISSEFCRGEFLVIDGYTYFFPGNCLQKGQWVKITFTNQDKAICTWKILTDEEGNALRVSNLSIVENTALEVTTPYTSVAHILWYFSFGLILLTVLVQHCFGNQIARYLFQKDRRYQKGIHPSGVGLLMYGNLLPFYGMMIAWRLYGYHAADFLMILWTIFYLPFFVSKRTTHAVYTEDVLTIYQWGRSQVIRTEEIQTVDWRFSNLPFGRRLDVKLVNRVVITFEQEYFWGLSGLYQEINKSIHNRKEIL